MSYQQDGGDIRSAIVIKATYARRTNGLYAFSQIAGVFLGVGLAVSTVLEGNLQARELVRGMYVPRWSFIVLGAALAIGCAVWFVRSRRSGGVPTVLVGWSRIQGGIEIAGLAGAARGAVMRVPDRAPVSITLKRTRTMNLGLNRFYGVVIAWQGGQQLFNVQLQPRAIDVSPLAQVLRQMGCPVQIDPKLGVTSVAASHGPTATPAAQAGPPQPSAPAVFQPQTPHQAPMQGRGVTEWTP